MSTTIEALYIYDELHEPIVEHIYTSRPPPAKTVVQQYLAHPTPRPSLLSLPDASPPTTVCAVAHPPLLLLCPSHSEVQPLAVLEFLHRVIDVFEDFLGAPLLPSKIENNYDVVAQLLGEMCDGGIICNTEANALRENVEVSDKIGKLFAQVGLPGSSPALTSIPSLSHTLQPPSTTPAIPWRRPNVRHTSNELYVDILESLSVILAPSGRPISALASGSIAFTAKISGVPDLLLVLSAPGASFTHTMQLPVFHPCVRLAWWNAHPGELSFVPPDGKFVLAGYEVDLLPLPADIDKPPTQAESRLFLPASVDMRTGLGSAGADFEIRLTLNTSFPGAAKPNLASNKPGNSFSFGGPVGGSSAAPTLEFVSVSVPVPDGVRSVSDLRASRGEATYSAWNKTLEWKVPTTKDAVGTAVLTGTIVGPVGVDETEDEADANAKTNPLLGYYDDEATAAAAVAEPTTNGQGVSAAAPKRSAQASKALMPTSVAVSFTVKGWLPSGIRIESLNVDARKSKGLGEGVRPYKGVKYITVSRGGVERRV